ncbi:NAD(P)-dependent oxidoreductase [Sulfuracidifex metallicus]|uniref:NAD(P)-dependent oxidoreductase n=1 Tax=Sulfuracidifex metallicus TaxID=47303 RepID=UPI0022725765|nr:NAD(P)-dependent oxidoreductase [Sulfuracidifex metallicus]MCY0850992.1 NAD(P)-dependent oxidoreductase [Sulfuracidifex metallicus]
MEVTVLGLGTMGWRIAKNYAKAGMLKGVWNRTEEKSKLFSKEFGVPVVSLDKISSRFILLSLSNDDAVTSVVRKIDVKGKVIIDTSTISPRTSKSLGKEISSMGGVMYDAPVTGSTGIEERKATVMLGGPKEGVEEVISLLKVTANKVIYVGDNGSGLYLKLVNNLIAASYMEALAEAFTLAERAGLDLEIVSSFLSEGSIISSPLSSMKSRMLKERNYITQFRLSLMAKDLGIIDQECSSLGVANMISSITAKLFASASRSGLGDLDMASIYELIRNL